MLTLTELASALAVSVLGDGVSDVALADAVDALVADVIDDAADAVEALLGDLGDADVFALVVRAFAEGHLRASIASTTSGGDDTDPLAEAA
jgi:hypothetical protein